MYWFSRVINKLVFFAAGISCLWGAFAGYALDPNEILVIANSQMYRPFKPLSSR
jgi:hypothetical protein